MRADEIEFAADLPVVTVEDTGWVPVNLADLPERDPVLPSLGSAGVVYPGRRHLFSGPPEAAKTISAYAIALDIVRDGGVVVPIDFEMGRWDARSLLREMGATDDDLARLHFVEPDSPATAEHVATLVALAPDLVIIDALAGAFRNEELDDNRRGEVETLIGSYVTPFRRAGIATVAIDHVAKNAVGRGQFAIGSERKVGGVDVHLGFEVIRPLSRGTTGLFKLVTHKDRAGRLSRPTAAILELTSEPETHEISWTWKSGTVSAGDADISRPTKLMKRVSDYLESQPDPVSLREVEDSVRGKSRESLRLAVEALIIDGYVNETKGARRARLLTSARPYTTSPDLAGPRPANSHPTSPTSPFPYGGGEVLGGVAGEITSPGDLRTGSDEPDHLADDHRFDPVVSLRRSATTLEEMGEDAVGATLRQTAFRLDNVRHKLGVTT